MTGVGFVVHEGRAPAMAAAEELVKRLAADGIDATWIEDQAGADLSVVVSVGGDGTFLRAAHAAHRAGCPVLGVKVGRMGFLTEVEPAGAEDLIRAVLNGVARIEERLAVIAEPEEEGGFGGQWALNEITVEKHTRHRLLRLAVYVDGGYVTTFSADGIIVATPTGSTAYSFSARGPIVTPTVNCLVLTPLAAHMVFDRSFVLDATQQVSVEVVGEERGLLAADGRESIDLPVGSRFRIRAADEPARLVRRGDVPGFLSLVREKFGLPGDDGPDVGAGR